MAEEFGSACDDGSKLNPSVLGTKEYWDESYSLELKNFNENGDVGEIWFGERSMNRMVKWILNSDRITKSSAVLDVGCGNGMLLVSLAARGFTNLTGVDYSSSAVNLAQSIATKEGHNISFLVCDILKSGDGPLSCKSFDVCVDKGTYDAISLNPSDAGVSRSVYIKCIHSLLTDKGFFLITSCNWTRAQLVDHFDEEFVLVDTIPAPTFTFGGCSGSTVTSVIFKKKS